MEKKQMKAEQHRVCVFRVYVCLLYLWCDWLP